MSTKAIIDQDNPPAGHELGGSPPVIGSLGELETAIETIAHIDSRRTTILAAHRQSVALLEDSRDQKLTIGVGGATLSLDNREDELRQAIADYVAAHRDAVFEAGTQTRQFARGSVQIRKSKPRLEPAAGQTKAKILARIVKRFQLAEKLARYAARLGVCPFVRFKPELDIAGAKKALEQNKLGRAALTSEGLRYIDDEEVVDVTIDQPQGRSTTPADAAP